VIGAYLNLGNALVKDPRLPAYVINEAQGGATTFDCPDSTLAQAVKQVNGRVMISSYKRPWAASLSSALPLE